MPPPKMPEPKPQTPTDVLDLGFAIANVQAGFILPFIRSGFGVCAFQGYLYTLLLMVLYAGVCRCPQLVHLIPPWLGLVAFRRLTADRKEHSRGQGYPWVLGWLVGYTWARWLEPFLCLGLGALLMPVSVPLAKFVAASAASLWLVWLMELGVMRAQERAQRDAEIEAYHMRRGER